MVTIAQLGPDDWAVFRALRIAALSDAPTAFISTLADERALAEPDWRTKLASRAQFVARDSGGAALGMVGALPAGDAIELISMWVAPAARGRGIGEALVRRVLRHARAVGCREVRLWLAEGNAGAERLYARCGFARTGVIQPIRGREPRREVAMRAGAAALAAADQS